MAKDKSNSVPLRERLRTEWRALAARWNALSLRDRWVLGLFGAFLAVVVLNQYPWQWARDWEAKGDRIEAALDRYSQRGNLVNNELVRAVSVFGPVEPPGQGDQDRIELGNAINDILKKHHVNGSSFESRTGQRLRDSDSAAFGGGGLERIQADVKFDVAPEVLPKVLADLESSPAIETISTLRLQRVADASKRIQVQATVEAWVIASRRRGQ